jgi:hypothetical protein
MRVKEGGGVRRMWVKIVNIKVRFYEGKGAPLTLKGVSVNG